MASERHILVLKALVLRSHLDPARVDHLFDLFTSECQRLSLNDFKLSLNRMLGLLQETFSSSDVERHLPALRALKFLLSNSDLAPDILNHENLYFLRIVLQSLRSDDSRIRLVSCEAISSIYEHNSAEASLDDRAVVREISCLLEDTSRFVVVAASNSLARVIVNENTASCFLDSTKRIIMKNSLDSRSCLVDVFTILLHESKYPGIIIRVCSSVLKVLLFDIHSDDRMVQHKAIELLRSVLDRMSFMISTGERMNDINIVDSNQLEAWIAILESKNDLLGASRVLSSWSELDSWFETSLSRLFEKSLNNGKPSLATIELVERLLSRSSDSSVCLKIISDFFRICTRSLASLNVRTSRALWPAIKGSHRDIIAQFSDLISLLFTTAFHTPQEPQVLRLVLDSFRNTVLFINSSDREELIVLALKISSQHEDSSVRESSIPILGLLFGIRVEASWVNHLLSLLADSNENVVLSGILFSKELISRLANHELLPVLDERVSHLLNSQISVIRDACVQYMIARSIDLSWPIVDKIVQDDDVDVRCHGCLLIASCLRRGSSQPQRLQEALFALTNDSLKVVRRTALQELINLSTEQIPSLAFEIDKVALQERFRIVENESIDYDWDDDDLEDPDQILDCPG